MTADPLGAGTLKRPKGFHAVYPTDPTTWNEYYYSADDPVNLNDPMGLAPDDCNTLKGTMMRLVYGRKDALGVGKGIIMRYYQQIYGAQFTPGTTGWTNHNNEIQKLQDKLQRTINQFNDDECPPPSGGMGQFYNWAYKPLPSAKDYVGPTQTPPQNVIQWLFNATSSVIFYEMLPALEDAFQDMLPQIEEVVMGIADTSITFGGEAPSPDDGGGGGGDQQDSDDQGMTESRLLQPPVKLRNFDGSQSTLAARQYLYKLFGGDQPGHQRAVLGGYGPVAGGDGSPAFRTEGQN